MRLYEAIDWMTPMGLYRYRVIHKIYVFIKK
jgi:hypothetical protein